LDFGCCEAAIEQQEVDVSGKWQSPRCLSGRGGTRRQSGACTFTHTPA
jgi:hypothetical protein